MLPERVGLALDDGDLERVGKELLQRRLLDPRQRLDARLGGFEIEGEQRRELAEGEALEDVDLRGLALAGDLDVLDGEARPKR